MVQLPGQMNKLTRSLKREFSKSSLFWNDFLNFSHGRFGFNMIWLIYLLCLTIFHLEWLKPENSCVRFEFLCQVFPFQAFRIEADLPEGTFHFVGRSLCQIGRWLPIQIYETFSNMGCYFIPVLVVQFLVSKAMILIECKCNVIKYLGSRRGCFI